MLPLDTFTNRDVTIGKSVLPIKDVFKALTDRDLWNEARRRGMVDEWDDFVHPNNVVADDLRSIPDHSLRQNLPEALRDVEDALSAVDSRFIGFADDVARHYARAA